jgi:hypothetical protein
MAKIKPIDAPNYYPEYPGFQALFRIPVVEPDTRLTLELPQELDELAGRGAKRTEPILRENA